MDMIRAINFPFDDDEWWVKILIGALVMLPGLILPFIPLGYQIYVARQVIRGKPRPLPGASEIGQVLTDGLIAFIALLVYFLPLTILGCCLTMMAAVLGESDVGGFLFLCLTLCLSAFLIPYTLIASALYLMGMIRYGETGNFSAFIKIGDLWVDVRAHLGPLVLLWLSLMGLSLAASIGFVVVMITCVGVPILAFYLYVVSGHLIGQVGQQIVKGY